MTRSTSWPRTIARLVVTLAAPVAYFAAGRAPIPPIKSAPPRLPLSWSEPFDDVRFPSFVCLGLAPIVTSSLLVAAGRWLLSRRHRAPLRPETAERRRITQVAIVTVVVSLLLGGLRSAVLPIEYNFPSTASLIVTTLWFASGATALLAVAQGVSRWGLGAGLAALLGSSAANEVARLASGLEALPAPQGIALACAIAAPVFMIAATLQVLQSPRSVGLAGTLSAGLVPIWLATKLVSMPSFVDQFEIDLGSWHRWFTYDQLGRALAVLALTNVLALVAAVASSRRLKPSELVFLTSLATCGIVVRGVSGIELSAFWVPVCTAVFLDVSQELRFRWRRGAVATLAVSRPLSAADLVDTLCASGVPCHARGAHVKNVFGPFGPFIEVAVLVSVKDEERARGLRDQNTGHASPSASVDVAPNAP